MTKVDIKRLDSVTANDTTATALINDNFKALQDAVENTLSRDGSTPNFMDADLDLNSYKIINCGEAVEDNDVVTLKYVEEAIGNAAADAQSAANSAKQAASSAQSALVSATNAATAVRNAETTISQANTLLEETQTYVDAAKVDIDATVAQAKTDVNQYVTDAEEEVKQIARDEATKAVENAAAEATQIATDTLNTYVDSTVKPSLQTYVDQATAARDAAAGSASAAKTSETNAKTSANAAANYLNELKTTATNAFNANATAKTNEFNTNASQKQAQVNASAAAAKTSETNAKTSETNAKTSETLAKQYADKAQFSSFGNIGDIQYTARHQVPNGGAWCDGSEYTQAQFPDIYQMLVANKLANIDYVTYNDRITNFGFCGFFGLDTTNKKFKVPTLKDMFIKAGTTAITATKESLPNIKGTLGNVCVSVTSEDSAPANTTGAFSATPVKVYGGNGTGDGRWIGYLDNTKIDASRSSSTYKDGAKVNPDHVVYRAYVVLYTSATEASEAQAAEFIQSVSNLTQQLTNKINVNANNISAAGYANIFTNILPDYGAPITVNTSANYTAPNYGWFRFISTADSEQCIIIRDLTGHLNIYGSGAARSYSPPIVDFIFVKKGHVYQFTKQWGTFGSLFFYPIKGV